MRAYSSDLRERVLADGDAGMSTQDVAAKYRVSASWVRRLKQRCRETGSIEPKPQRHGPVPSWAEHADRIAAAIRQRPDDTLAEHRARLGLNLSLSSWWRATQAVGLTVKKVLRAAEQDRPDVARARQRWRAEMPGLTPEQLVFLDETWASTNMPRRYGRSPRGQRLVLAVPHGHGKTATFIAGLRLGGLVAPTVVDGAVHGELFEACVRQELVPSLRPGDRVMMDNLACPKRAGVRQAIESAGARLLHLPPTAPTSTRSSRPSPSSKLCCGRSASGPSKDSGGGWANGSMSSRRRSAATSSHTAETPLQLHLKSALILQL